MRPIMSNGETTRVSDLDLVSPTVMHPSSLQYLLCRGTIRLISDIQETCARLGYHRNCRCATSRIGNGLYPHVRA